MAQTKKHLALVTGASSGIGEAIARRLAKEGCSLILTARRLDRLEALKKDIEKNSKVEVHCLSVDLNEPGSVRALWERASQIGPVSILINNAGMGYWAPFAETTWIDHAKVLRLNMQAVTELAYYYSRSIFESPDSDRAYLLNVSSIGGFQAISQFSVYTASKAFVLTLSEALALEFKKTRLQVSCLCPGGTQTEFIEIAGQKLQKGSENFMMSAGEVADIAVTRMFAGKTLIIPGFSNKLTTFLPRILPRKWSAWVSSTVMRKAVSSS